MVDDSRVVRMRRRCWRKKRERIDDCSLSNDWWSGGLWIHLLKHVLERVMIGAGDSNSLSRWQALMRLLMKMIAAAVFLCGIS